MTSGLCIPRKLRVLVRGSLSRRYADHGIHGIMADGDARVTRPRDITFYLMLDKRVGKTSAKHAGR